MPLVCAITSDHLCLGSLQQPDWTALSSGVHIHARTHTSRPGMQYNHWNSVTAKHKAHHSWQTSLHQSGGQKQTLCNCASIFLYSVFYYADLKINNTAESFPFGNTSQLTWHVHYFVNHLLKRLVTWPQAACLGLYPGQGLLSLE